jgi:Sodium:sulfate symporter transmembrane region
LCDRTPTLSWRFAAPIVVRLALLLVPHPTGLSPIAWRYLGLFAGVIVALRRLLGRGTPQFLIYLYPVGRRSFATIKRTHPQDYALTALTSLTRGAKP